MPVNGGPLSRDEFNRKFCTGFPVSISFPRARARFHFTSPLPSPASIVAPSKSESPIFSRFFRELENERFAFEFISTLLFVDGNRSLSAYFWSRFFFILLLLSFFLSFFEHVLFGLEKSRGGISIFNRVIGLIRIISRIDRNTSLCFVLLENIDRSPRKF